MITLKLLVEAGAPVTEADVGIAASMGRHEVQAYLKSRLAPRESAGGKLQSLSQWVAGTFEWVRSVPLKTEKSVRLD